MKKKDFAELVKLLQGSKDVKVSLIEGLYYEDVGLQPDEKLIVIHGDNRVFVIQGENEHE